MSDTNEVTPVDGAILHAVANVPRLDEVAVGRTRLDVAEGAGERP